MIKSPLVIFHSVYDIIHESYYLGQQTATEYITKIQEERKKQFHIPEYTERQVLTAYLEKVDQQEWNVKPLPIRRNAHASKLKKITYPKLTQCSKLPSQWPVDNYPEDDPFLPWIHDVFPSADGKVIHFVAQNKRRCHTGIHMSDVKEHFQPQVSLFQHVPIKRIYQTYGGKKFTRYKLTSHEEADPDGIETRFICRFKPSMKETLSIFPFNYDYVTYRKYYKHAFTREGFDNHVIWTSMHLFDCPVPKELQEVVKSGISVLRDYATLFVDLIPIRTPPRYRLATDFLPPKYNIQNNFSISEEYGDDNIMPMVEDSGRWENIPICKPSLMTYGEPSEEQLKRSASAPKIERIEASVAASAESINSDVYTNQDHDHTLIACTWTSNKYQTRKAMTVGDGERRLKEWITFHLLAGVDHIYIYDNSGAFDKAASLKSVTDQFSPTQVTRVDWPSRVCNNRPLNQDDKGERSSQYAAESSCRMRFGPYAKWLVSMDIDEYLIPMGEYKTLKDLLPMLEKRDIKIYSFKSWRTRPIFDRLEPPEFEECYSTSTCFNLRVRNTSSFLHTYNCEQEKPPKTLSNPAEKQIYRTDYVLMHFVHYSVITTDLILTKEETDARQDLSWRQRFNDRKNQFSNEVTEATMIHTKSVPYEHTRDFEKVCKKGGGYFGFPWPNGIESKDQLTDEKGFYYSCFINEEVDEVWIPRLHRALGIPPNEEH